MAGGGQSNDDDIITDINVTPLVDVVLVLLIILMVTATAIVSKAINVELPKAATGEHTPNEELTVSIDRKGQVFLNQSAVTLEELRRKVSETHTKNPDVRAIIAADGQLAYAKVVQIIDLLRQEKVMKFDINVQPESIAPRKKE
jgi:biopolymer transport protein ExbD